MEETANMMSLKSSPCGPCKVKWEGHQDGILLATMHCIDCEENLCESCSKYHITQKMAKNHKIVALYDAIRHSKTIVADSLNLAADETSEPQSLNSPEDEKEQLASATNYYSECNEILSDKSSESHLDEENDENHRYADIDKSTTAEEDSQSFSIPAQNLSSNKNEGLDLSYVHVMPHERCDDNQCIIAIPKSAIDESVSTRTEGVDKTIQPTGQASETLSDQQITKSPAGTAHNESKNSQHHNSSGMLKEMSEDDRRLSTSNKMDAECRENQTSMTDSVEQTNRDACDAEDRRTPATVPSYECNGTLDESVKTKETEKEIRSTSEFDNSSGSHSTETQEDSSDTFSKSKCPEQPSLTTDSVDQENRERNLQSLKSLLKHEFQEWLTDKAYSKLSPIVMKPLIQESDLKNVWKLVSPYLIQRIKMWNGNVVSPQNITSFIERKSSKRRKVTQKDSNSVSVSRIDFLTLVLNAADQIVAQDILIKLSKFHIAVPLVVQDLIENGKFIVTLPFLRNICIKCEPKPGEIIENHLFSKFNQFQMIVAVRIGKNKIGKSTIFNHVMRKTNMFSSCDEPCISFERPQTLDGMVEMIWLTQDTCIDSAWKAVFHQLHQRNSQEVVLLANLHGEAMHHLDTIKYLATLESSFIVFQMPDCTNEQYLQLEETVSSNKVIPLLVNPKDNETDTFEIFTDSLRTEEIRETMTRVLEECLSKESERESIVSNEFPPNYTGNVLRFPPSIECQHAKAIVTLARESGCLVIKQLMKYKKDTNYDPWSPQLRSLIQKSIDMFCLSSKHAKTSLTYLETQLSKISAQESASSQADVRRINEKLRKIVRTPKKITDKVELEHETELRMVRQELQKAMKRVDDHNLGQEHFFRLVGEIYKDSKTNDDFKKLKNVQHLPANVAELLINGHAIEILDGDSGDIQSIWIQAIFKSVTKKFPNLRVFVISIIGVQSSGKSTLLNALFSCRFAVSVGRCSRGLFMRMIFLDDQLKESQGFDCILLIDTEGLCSPEKINDEKASHKDRLMATFAMGISNLTIVNILGEGMTEMTEILQIAIVAMARLRSGGIRPDILMVQHLQERHISKMEQAKGQFCEAISTAFELISLKDVEIGSASAECLKELVIRIHSGDLFKHFGAFKDGSSVNSSPSESYHEDVVSLYEVLLQRAKNCKTRSTFELWSQHFEGYWSCAKQENFALNFKNIKHISEFLYFEKMIAKVKEELDTAVRFHREIFSKKIKEIVGCLIASKSELKADEVGKKLFKDIEVILDVIPYTCAGNTFNWSMETGTRSTDNATNPDCEACSKFKASQEQLFVAISETEWDEDTKKTITDHRDRLVSITKTMLRQTFEGSVVRQGYFSDFSDIISKELEAALKARPHGKYSDKEIQEFVKKIFLHLKRIAFSNQAELDMREQIYRSVTQEYKSSEISQGFKSEITLDGLKAANSCKPAGITKFTNFMKKLIHSSSSQNNESSKLSVKQMERLIYVLKQFILSILQCKKDWKLSPNSVHEKVKQLKIDFPTLIVNYEAHCKVHLSDPFKRDLEIYALQEIEKKLPASAYIHEKLNKALIFEYVKTRILPKISEDFENQITTDNLVHRESVKSMKGDSTSNGKLDKKLQDSLTDLIHNLVSKVLRNRDENWSTAGLNFEDGMVSEIRTGFSEEIKMYEKKFGLVLHDNFKISLQVYTLQQLRDRMIDLQTIWNQENKPSEILEQKREDYRCEIETRLKHGFSGAGEGLIISRILSKVIKATAINEAYLLKIQTVKDAPWTTNAESVRLYYFEKLAEEVASGDKERALDHFRDPKSSIEKWFKHEIDSMHIEEKVIEKYRETFTEELSAAIQKVNNCKTKPEIDNIVRNYMKSNDDQYYSKFSGQEFDIKTFKSSLTDQLEKYSHSGEEKLTNFPPASDDPVIMGRLGCTEHCFWCGSLCWGSRDHQTGKETGRKIERHHSCHQSPGLKGTHNSITKELYVASCHLWNDDMKVYFGEFYDDDKGLRWSIAKEEHFKDWKFDAHCVVAFDELMRWFFQELHVDLAEMYTLLPANGKLLEEHQCQNLKLEDSLAVVRSKNSF